MTGLMLVVIDEYGTEALDWDPETIKMELEDDFHVELSSSTLDKICVGAQLLTTKKFYKSLPDLIIFAIFYLMMTPAMGSGPQQMYMILLEQWLRFC